MGRLRLTFGGAVAGIVFFCISWTPSLLPRGAVVQGVASGLSFVTGYAIGVGLEWLYHQLPRRYRWQVPSRLKAGIWYLAALLALAAMIAGYHWQNDVRAITQAPPADGIYPLRVMLVAVVIAWLLIAAGRGVRHVARYLGAKLDKYLPARVARLGGAVLAAVLLVVVVNGVLLRSIFGFINYSFGLANKGTPDGIYQPHNTLFSGSPSSKIDWNTLGEKGREFVASAPSASAIAAWDTSHNAKQPSRLYVGLSSAPELSERVDLLIDELNRTHAADRQAILIAIPTGSGGIDAKAVQSVEYLYGGDTTTLGIQYSYLPSWLSFVSDQDIARQTGKAITEAVYDWWQIQPEASRPRLLFYGESLGTLGADGAFSGPADMQARMHGVLLAGPPHANTLWRTMVTNRDEGSPQVLPVYQQGRVVRFSDGHQPLFAGPQGEPWEEHRVGIVQNASDPVVWASTDLFVHRPDWLKEPKGSDVVSSMHWYPFVTGWQVALDLPFAFSATPGHGHRYDPDLTAAWTAILHMRLTAAQAEQLQQIIDDI